jgi:hypothetical protein
MGRQGARLLVLCGLNYVTTLAIVVGLSHIWSLYLASKMVATSFNAGFNYFAYRRWVFEHVADVPVPAPSAPPGEPSADIPKVGSSAQHTQASLRG